MRKRTNKKLSVFQLLTISFLALVLLGSLLLSLPIASRSGKTNFIDALFISTSATCVTGLVSLDPNAHFTLFGQIVILCLIQLGGLGFMTFVSVAFYLIKGKMSVYQNKILAEISGQGDFNTLTTILKRTILTTLIVETIGALILCTRFIPIFGARGIYVSVWTSISAFCNAGFDILTKVGASPSEQFKNLIPFANEPVILITVSLLILIGGFGFFVWSDLLDCKFKFKKLQLYTKIVLIANLILVVITTTLFVIFEYNNTASNPLFADMNFFEKLSVGFFNAVSPRTAGFSIVNYSAMTDSGYLLTLITMFIGGNSCSTAGGVKINTIAIIVITTIGVYRGKNDTDCYNKRITKSTIKKALAVFLTYFVLTIISVLLLLAFEKSNKNIVIDLKSALFEVVSALCTVGLSFGITPQLTIASKILLCLLMFAGRVGVFTIFHSIKERSDINGAKKPTVNLMVG